jgi:hypothetical protein
MFGDYRPAHNITERPDSYEVENRAIDPDGLVLATTQSLTQDELVEIGS